MNLLIQILLLVAALTTGAVDAFAHGEDKPGPHGGVIRMPGAFHTELKQTGPKTFDLFLLDVEWKNSIAQNSTVQAALNQKDGTKRFISCSAKRDRFSCVLKRNSGFKKGDVVSVTASRNGMAGGAVTYPYPFQVGPVSEDHSSHGH